MGWFLTVVVLIVLVGGYFLFIRPLLEQNPRFKELTDWEVGFGEKLSLRFAGIKQKLTTRLVVLAGVAVSAYDFALPLARAAGFDVTTYEPLTHYVPSAAWPFITMGLLGLVQYFRNLSDKAVAADNPPVAG